MVVAVTALVFALGGSVAGADPPPWAHGGDHGQHGNGGGPPDQGGGPPSAAQGNGPGDSSPPPDNGGPGPGAGSPPSQGDNPGGNPGDNQGGNPGDNPGDNPGHGGTPPGQGGTPPGHEHHHGHGGGDGGGDGGPSTTSQPTPAPTQAPNTPAVTTPVTAPPVVTPPSTTPSTTPSTPPVVVTTSPGPRPGIKISTLAIGTAHGASPARLGTAAAAAGGGAFLGNPLATPLAPATAFVAGAPTGPAGTKTFTHPGQRLRTIVVPPSSSPVTAIAHFISVIPTAVWIALAVAIGLAAMGGGAAVALGRRASRQAGEVAAVTAAALTDQLTGVLNRRGFTQSAERELERARRYGHPLAIAYVDVRGLKAVNDSEGHLAGDRLLREVALMLSQSARAYDIVGRMGGDELAVLLAEQAEPGAEAMTKRVREQIPSHRAELGLATQWDVTVGTASFPDDGNTLDDLLAAADRRMYEQRGIELQES